MYLSCLLSQLCAPLRTHNFYNCVSLSHLAPCELCAPLANLWVPPSYLISYGYHSVSCVHPWATCIIQVRSQLCVMLLQLRNHSVKWWITPHNSLSDITDLTAVVVNTTGKGVHKTDRPVHTYNWPVGINSWVKSIFNSVSDNMTYWVVCWSVVCITQSVLDHSICKQHLKRLV